MTPMLNTTIESMRRWPRYVTSVGFVFTSVALSALLLNSVQGNAQAKQGLYSVLQVPSADPAPPQPMPPSITPPASDAPALTPPALPTPDNTASGANTSQGDNTGKPALNDDDENQPGEVLTRGPMHEAFARPVAEKPEPTKVINKKPPEAIEEVAPENQPEGQNVVWIPGYFSWDDERNDFIWISGVYRDTPPGQAWVAGYWRRS